MLKLAIATFLALAIPFLWTIGVKANASTPSIHQERQVLRMRQTIMNNYDQMQGMYKMMNSRSAHRQTASGLIEAADKVNSASVSTSDYYALEMYNQQITNLRGALQVVMHL